MLTLKVPGLQKPVATQSIVWIQGVGNYARIYFRNGEEFLASRTLKWFDSQLPQFVRIRKSVLINSNHVTRCQWNQSRNVLVTVRTGNAFSVARRRIGLVAESLAPIQRLTLAGEP